MEETNQLQDEEREIRDRCCKKILEVRKEFLEYCDEVERKNRRLEIVCMILTVIGTCFAVVCASFLVRFILANIFNG